MDAILFVPLLAIVTWFAAMYTLASSDRERRRRMQIAQIHAWARHRRLGRLGDHHSSERS